MVGPFYRKNALSFAFEKPKVKMEERQSPASPAFFYQSYF